MKFKREIIIPLASWLAIFFSLVVLKVSGNFHLAGYIVPPLFVLIPLLLEKSNEKLGLNPSFKGILFALLCCVLLFPPAFLFLYAFDDILGLTLSPSLPSPELFIIHFAGVAIPEELFFRGFLQERLHEVFGRRWKILGANTGPALIVTSLIFTVTHLVAIAHPIRYLVFFPSLVFGYLRDRFSSIWSPVVFHALSNVFVQSVFS